MTVLYPSGDMSAPTPTEVAAAAARARSILETRARGDYAPSTVLGDLVVDGHAVIYADLYAQIAALGDRQSLLALRDAPQNAETRDAMNALLGNLFVSASVGSFARGVATLHFTARVDALLPRATRFFKAGGLVYYPDIANDTLIEASHMRPRYGDRGEVTSWTYDVNLVAARTGTAYRTSSGRFATVDAFSPYLAYAENTDAFGGGTDPDTSAQALVRADTALSLRAFLNARSADATLRGKFAELLRVRTIGMGDPEMVRDLLDAGVFGVAIHRGGHVDIFTDLPTQRVTARLVVGEAAPRADRVVATFVDATASFISAGVLVGDVLHVASGLVDAPRDFKIAAVRATALDVVPSTPFATATEDAPSPPNVVYSVGDNYPAFDNHVASGSRPARTSQAIALSGHVVLPAGPVGTIARVEVPAPSGDLAPFVDPTTGVAVFSARRNGPWPRAPRPGEPLSYRVVGHNPREAQSMRAVTTLELGWGGATLDGTEVLVTYETPLGFAAVDALVASDQDRVPGANTLARAPHPVYVSFTLPYRQRTLPRTPNEAVAAVDEARVLAALVAFVEASPVEGLDVAGVTSEALRADSNIGGAFSFTIAYEALLPDGRVARYTTEDRVTLFPGEGTTARLRNPADFGLAVGDAAGLARLLGGMGLSNRVVRYRTNESLVALALRS